MTYKSPADYHVKFRTEYICLKCGYLTDTRIRACPRCGGSMCPRIIRTYADKAGFTKPG